MELTDSVVLDEGSVRITRDGYLVANARTARVGIQLYRGSEVGLPQTDVVRVYRPEAQVFEGDSMATFAYRPMTNSHPPKLVTSDTWRDHAVGFTAGDVARDGDFIRVPLMLTDAATIKDWRDGKCELSVGYTCDLDFTPGETPDGEAYDAMQINIRANHIALEERGRAGPKCRIGDTDHQQREPDMPDNLRTVLVDGISIMVTDQGAQAIDKLQRQLNDALASSTSLTTQHDAAVAALRTEHERSVQGLRGQMSASDAEHVRALDAVKAEVAGIKAAHQTALDAKDAEIAGLNAGHTSAIAAKDAEIAALKAAVPDSTAMDALITERVSLIAAAKRFLGDAFDPTGKSNTDIRRAAVAKGIGDQAAGEMQDDHVRIAFDTMMRIAPQQPHSDPIRNALRVAPVVPGTSTTVTTGDAIMDARNAAAEARRAHLARMEGAWKQPAA